MEWGLWVVEKFHSRRIFWQNSGVVNLNEKKGIPCHGISFSRSLFTFNCIIAFPSRFPSTSQQCQRCHHWNGRVPVSQYWFVVNNWCSINVHFTKWLISGKVNTHTNIQIDLNSSIFIGMWLFPPLYVHYVQSESGGSNATWQVKWKPLHFHRSTVVSSYRKKNIPPERNMIIQQPIYKECLWSSFKATKEKIQLWINKKAKSVNSNKDK